MKHFCTYFNETYLTRGLALYHSLGKYCKQPFKLWILCLDKKTEEILDKLALKNVHLISMDEFEEFEPRLQDARNNRSLVEFFWTCTPILPLYVFEKQECAESVTYLDADLWFKNDPAVLFEELHDSSVLIVGHRYSERYAGKEKDSGIYNVSWVTFKREENAFACLNWWKDKCLDTCQLDGDGATCGDQKYLDEWSELFAGVKELPQKGAGLAPWNLGRYNITAKGDDISVDDEPLIFFHFHGLKQVDSWFVRPVDLHYTVDCNSVIFGRLYYPYARELNRCHRMVKKTGFDLPQKEIEISGTELFDELFYGAYFMCKLKVIAKWVWNIGHGRYMRMLSRMRE